MLVFITFILLYWFVKEQLNCLRVKYLSLYLRFSLSHSFILIDYIYNINNLFTSPTLIGLEKVKEQVKVYLLPIVDVLCFMKQFR